MRPGLIVCLFLVPALLHAQESSRPEEEILTQAQAAFQQGIESKSRLLQARKHFSKATDAFLELHQRGVRSPALFRNLGDAAVLADRWPIAIWAYNTSLKLDPNDRAMREHLAFARGKVLYPPSGQGRPDADVWPIWLRRPTIGELACVGVLSYFAAWLAGTCAFMLRSIRLALVSFFLAALAMAAGVGWWQLTRQADIDRETPLVVLAAKADFHRGNGTSYPKHPVLPVLPRGLEARQTHRRGNWLQIRLSTGETGWVHVGQVLIVDP